MMFMRASAIACLLLCLAATAEAAVGYQTLSASSGATEPLRVSVWYPSDGEPADTRVGLFVQNVAANAAPSGRQLPLVVVSHGNGGSLESHVGTALALANAGFVVAAVEHQGDNYRDQSRAAYIENRSLELARAIDHLLTAWQHSAVLDADRIGAFGFSAGGFSVLALAGGQPDMSRIADHCKTHPRQYVCRVARGRRPDAAPGQATSATAAARPAFAIRALVVAAPALGFTFVEGLGNVQMPVQLWRADRDEILPEPHYADAVRSALPRPAEFHAVPGAGHYDFLAPCSEQLRKIAPQICRSAPGFDRSAFHEEFNASVVGFFARELDAPAEATAPKP